MCSPQAGPSQWWQVCRTRPRSLRKGGWRGRKSHPVEPKGSHCPIPIPHQVHTASGGFAFQKLCHSILLLTSEPTQAGGCCWRSTRWLGWCHPLPRTRGVGRSLGPLRSSLGSCANPISMLPNTPGPGSTLAEWMCPSGLLSVCDFHKNSATSPRLRRIMWYNHGEKLTLKQLHVISC